MSRHAIDLDYYEIDKEWDDRMDTLPVWNDAWEKRDPLRGKRGWTRRDYVNSGVAGAFVAAAVGLFALPIASARNLDDRARRMNLQREQHESALLHPQLPLLHQTNDDAQDDAGHD